MRKKFKLCHIISTIRSALETMRVKKDKILCKTIIETDKNPHAVLFTESDLQW